LRDIFLPALDSSVKLGAAAPSETDMMSPFKIKLRSMIGGFRPEFPATDSIGRSRRSRPDDRSDQNPPQEGNTRRISHLRFMKSAGLLNWLGKS
jgi:hypothetical protein